MTGVGNPGNPGRPKFWTLDVVKPALFIARGSPTAAAKILEDEYGFRPARETLSRFLHNDPSLLAECRADDGSDKIEAVLARSKFGDAMHSLGRPLIKEACCVYIIGPENGPVKIGHAVKPKNRLRDLQIGNHLLLILHATFWSRDRNSATKVECASHRTLDDMRLRGEWFDVDVITASTVIRNSSENKGVKLYESAKKALADAP